MNKKLLILLFFSQFVYAEVCTNDIENLDICYSISIQQAFYMYPVSNTYIDSFEIDPGSVESEFTECPEGDCDVIAVFYNDVCIGWTYPLSGNGYLSVCIFVFVNLSPNRCS